MSPLTVMTVVGTRPEIIRLAPTIRALDTHTKLILVHTGQNYDYELNEIFFEDLGLRRPDHFLRADTSSLGAALGSILARTEQVLAAERPDAFLVLGDTNSCISAIMAKRRQVPVFHMEAGNRSFDLNVPEETNRRIIDHVADYNLAYTEHARRNLLAEGLHPSTIIVTGSPMAEVIDQHRAKIDASDVLSRLGLTRQGYFLVSVHREENVDLPERLAAVVDCLQAVRQTWGLPVLVSTHPRTRQRLEALPGLPTDGLRFHAPFGFTDYVKLQVEAKAVLSDSGTISEESSLLGFPAVTLRDFIERPEAVDTGSIITAGIDPDSVLAGLTLVEALPRPRPPVDYQVRDTSTRVVSFIVGTVHSHRRRQGLLGGARERATGQSVSDSSP
jgi:UDP-N-acetylglucosamine 2-epimerase (non-hydrolysing)